MSQQDRHLLDRIEDALVDLPEPLHAHVQRVREIATDLAHTYGVDLRRADLAAAAHDLARAERDEVLLKQAKQLGIPLDPASRAMPMLLHGPVGAHLARQRYGIEDPEVLGAVRWHTTGTGDLSLLGKVVFLADKLDPQKAGRYPFLDRVRRLARGDLDEAITEFLEQDMRRLLDHGHLIHPASLDARNHLRLKRLGPGAG